MTFALVKCTGCPTMVMWGKWPKTGKRMCAEPDDRGNLVLKDGYWWVYAQPDNPEFDGMQRYTSHFANCPKAKEFRR